MMIYISGKLEWFKMASNTILNLLRRLHVGIILILITVVGVIQLVGIVRGVPLCLVILELSLTIEEIPSH